MSSKYTISGAVVNSLSKQGIANVKVEAWDKDLIFNDFLGNAITDEKGQFRITFTQQYFRELFLDRKPDLFFKVFRDDELIKSTQHEVLWNVSEPDVNIIIVVDSQKGGNAGARVVISGKVFHSNGNVVPSVQVRANWQMIRDKKTISASTTDSDGAYSLDFSLPDPNAAIVIEAVDTNGKTIASSAVLFAPTENQQVDLMVTDEQYKGNSQFVENNHVLESYWNDLNKAGGPENISVNDILFMAGQTAKDPLDVWRYVQANALAQQTKIPAEAFFGLFKTGLPADARSLLTLSPAAFADALKKAGTQNAVSGGIASSSDELAKAWSSYRGNYLLNAKTNKIDATPADILKLVVTDTEKQTAIVNAFADSGGNQATVWQNVAQITNNQTAQQLKNTVALGGLVGLQPDMTRSLVEEVGAAADPLKELAKKNAGDWAGYINDLSQKLQKSVVPSFITGDTEADRVKAYAGYLDSYLESTYPSPSFIGNLNKASEAQGAFATSRPDLIKFFENNGDYDIRTTPSMSLIDPASKVDFSGIKDKNALLGELKSIQRLVGFTSSYKAMTTLKAKELDSAFSMVQVPRIKFVTDLKDDLGSQQKAIDLYDQAATRYMQALAMYGYLHPSLHSTGATPDAPNLRNLFGSLDVCECEECNSIFGAAAYFTDCLQFLQTQAPAAYAELTRRRPDLTKIKLTCKNTNTILPAVDLVIELLEDFVIDGASATTRATLQAQFPKDPYFVDRPYQTTWQESELAANPEHLNYSAYEQLRLSIYPQVLPFNLPLEEARVYLKHLSVERYQLMTTFFAGNEVAAFNDPMINLERLLISLEEANILTGVTTGDGGPTTGLWNFYGFDKDNGFQALTDPQNSGPYQPAVSWVDALKARVDVFLQQTAIKYEDLITLRLCDLINPLDNAGNRRIGIVAAAGADPDTCELDKLILQGLDENAATNTHDLKIIHRFIRLWRKLGWTMYQVDLAIKAFPPTGDTPAEWSKLLTKISQVVALGNRLNLSVETVLSFFGKIDTTSTYIDYFSDGYPAINSLYQQLFQNKQVIFPLDPAFADPSALAGSLDDHTATLLAALQLGSKDYNDLKSDSTVLADNKLTLDNLSSLYRHAMLARAINLSIRDFLTCKALTGVDPFTDPGTAFDFLLRVDTILSCGFSIDQVNYLLRHDFKADTGVAPADDEISLFLSELRAALRAIKNSTPDILKNTIIQKFAEKLTISKVAASNLLSTLSSGVTPGSHLVDDFWAADFSTSPFLQNYFDPPGSTIQIEPSGFVRSLPTGSEVAVPALFQGYMRLGKAASIINQMKLTDDELQNLLGSSGTIGCSDLRNLPVALTAAGNFNAFRVLAKLVAARDMLPIGTPLFFDILNHAIAPGGDPSPKLSWLTDTIKRTNWDTDVVQRLVIKSDPALAGDDGGILKAGFPNDFVNGNLLLRIKNCLDLLKRIGLTPALVAGLIQQNVHSGASQSIKNAAKSKYDADRWSTIAKPLRDILREKQREALCAYAIARPDSTKNQRWKDSNELFFYFLIDVETRPSNMTSRIVTKAISSVQLFIDRVLLNLEYPLLDITQPRLQLDADTAYQWNEWRKLYRVWEANRMVFCYPENYVLPELRTTKTPLFKELETDLNQNELNKDNVEGAFQRYLEKLDEVARLEIVGMYHQQQAATDNDKAVDITHVFARTYSYPQKYFHRTFENGVWTAWLRMDIDVDGSIIAPVVFHGRLCLFWLFLTMQSDKSDSLDPNSSLPAPPKYWRIQAAWSIYHNGKWKAKRLSKNVLETDKLSSHEDNLNTLKQRLFIRTEITSDNKLILHVESVADLNSLAPNVGNFVTGGFIFDNCNTDPELIPMNSDIQNDAYKFPCVPPSGTESKDMQFTAQNESQNFWVDHVYEFNNAGYSRYGPTPGWGVLHNVKNGIFRLVVSTNFPVNPLQNSFFFQDTKCTFYVSCALSMSSTDNTGQIFILPGAGEMVAKVYPPVYTPPETGPDNLIDLSDPVMFFQSYKAAADAETMVQTKVPDTITWNTVNAANVLHS